MSFDFPLTAVDVSLLAFINIGVFVSAVLVLTMQPGFMLFEAGNVSRKNVLNNIFKNIIDLCVGGLAFLAIGYPTLTGEGPVIDLLAQFGLTREAPAGPPMLVAADPALFLFNFGFASAAATICSGAVTGRVSPYAYVLFAAMFGGLIYPVLAFLFWNAESALYGTFTDFAGAVIVHAAGAAAGLAGAVLLRPRIGFSGYDPVGVGRETLFRLTVSHQPHNLPLAGLGMFLLWLGWFGFNSGTLLAGGAPAGIDPALADGAGVILEFINGVGVIAMNTALAPCAAAVTTVALQSLLREPLGMQAIMNGVIAGLVGVTAAPDILSPAGALLVGAASAIAYRICAKALVRIFVDDPVSVVAAHGAPGIIAAVAAGLAAPSDEISWFSQLVIASAIFLGVFLASIVAFKIAALLCRLFALLFGAAPVSHLWRGRYLRVHPETEIVGLDEELHGQEGYNFRDRR